MSKSKPITTLQVWVRPTVVAKRVGVHVKTIHAWLRAGVLPSVIVGKRRMVHLDALAALENRAVDPAQPGVSSLAGTMQADRERA